ncbi:MAG: hypothetical protein HKP61_08415, partial [Dactylosporangium sp.]|nr:hypothetical protein [Dactylosporangium sp.]NNJ60960.1 hypothetical protein [Dactylosporangium sp.]
MRLVLRLLRTRYGAALSLVLLLTMVVLAFRGVEGSHPAPGTAPPLEPSRPVSAEPSGYDEVVDDPSEPSTPSLAVSV